VKKPRIIIAAVLAVVGICLVAAVIYVSLLGENGKINDLAEGFFEKVLKDQYELVTSDVYRPPGEGEFSKENLPDSLFVLQLSLLKYYGCQDGGRCDIAIKKDHMWVPFVMEGPVRVSISLKRSIDKGLRQVPSAMGRLFMKRHEPDFIDGLLTVERRHGKWVITGINLPGSKIEKIYADLSGRLNPNKYARVAPNYIVLHELNINTTGIDPVERKLLLHVLRKVQAGLGDTLSSSDEESGRGMPF